MEADLEQIKSRWNDILDEILRQDRILWLTFFDARLASFSDGVLTLDFLDPGKFASEHDFSYVRNPERLEKVRLIAQNILGFPLNIRINSTM